MEASSTIASSIYGNLSQIWNNSKIYPLRREEGRTPSSHQRRSSVVENRSDLGIAHIRLVIPVEAGIHGLRELLALQCLYCRFDDAGADADRVLGDRARLC